LRRSAEGPEEERQLRTCLHIEGRTLSREGTKNQCAQVTTKKAEWGRKKEFFMAVAATVLSESQTPNEYEKPSPSFMGTRTSETKPDVRRTERKAIRYELVARTKIIIKRSWDKVGASMRGEGRVMGAKTLPCRQWGVEWERPSKSNI